MEASAILSQAVAVGLATFGLPPLAEPSSLANSDILCAEVIEISNLIALSNSVQNISFLPTVFFPFLFFGYPACFVFEWS
jgi:hypothetical protein